MSADEDRQKETKLTLYKINEAIRKYGRHKSWCESFKQDRNTMGMGLTKRKCSCGFEQASKGDE